MTETLQYSRELARRYVLFIISLFFSGLGVAFTKHGELGVSPISSVANVMYIKFPMLSMGNWLIIWNCILIVGQILLLRKKFQLIQRLESPCSTEEQLLDAAVAADPKRIVIKRPLKGPYLADRKPSYSLDGKAIRYDCFVFARN